MVSILEWIRNQVRLDLLVSNIVMRLVNFKATGDCLIIAPMFICEKKHIDEIIEKLRTGITNYAKSKRIKFQ